MEFILFYRKIRRSILQTINKFILPFGLRIIRNRGKIPRGFIKKYNSYLAQLRRNRGEFLIEKDLYYDVGSHPSDYMDYECEFASYHINRLKPGKILDVGSYRHFILGMLCYSKVTTVDVRTRESSLKNEEIITCDAKKINLTDNTFDAVISLCSLEHFGLGRYGDDFDIDADKRAFMEMVRVLKIGGHLIFTTLIRKNPVIIFNAYRAYSYGMIKNLCSTLACEEEKIYSHRLRTFCNINKLSDETDVYCGCWRKIK